MKNVRSCISTVYFDINKLRVSCGRPNVGTVADIMRSDRQQYHLAVKSLLRSQTV